MSNIPFRVMRGEEIAILSKPFTEGQVYFATDTKRIYMDAYLNGESLNKLPMGGGNSGIYYAHKGFTDSSDVSFSLEDIEGNELPNVNDVIVNYKSSNEMRDGFYKVVTSNTTTNTVETEYLPVGGGSGGGTGSSGGKILIKPITAAVGITTLEKGYSIKYSLEAYNNADAPVTNAGRATFIINGVQIDGGAVTHGGTYDFPITQYLSTVKDTNTVTLKITLNTGGIVDNIQTYTWTVKCVDLQLIWDWNYSSENYIKEDFFTLSWKVKGGVNCRTHISVDDGDVLDKNYFIIDVMASQSEASKTFNRMDAKLQDTFAYGAHKVTMWLTTQIGTEDIHTDPINQMLTFIGGNETGPILTVPYFIEKATQYDTLRIPFLVYKPDTEKLKVAFYVDNVEVLTDEYTVTATEPHYWPYTLGHAGEVKLKIAFTSYPEVEHNINLKVSPLDLGIKEPTEGLTFSLKASNISGNAQLKQLETEGKVTFSNNFDWTNGGLKSEMDDNGNISNYICVRQGTSMTLNYKLFENTQVGAQGKTFKFCFKAVNCYDYEAPVLECYEENTKLGLKFNAQQALFSSSANNNFATQFCEGSYIELETEIWPDQADSGYRPGDRFLMFWVDGVPAGVQTFNNGTRFIQNVPKTITIGSDQCDVYVYVAKIYEKRLSSLEHLNGFILDAPNVNEILARFNRNDILGSNNEISYEKLVKNNPGCHAYLYKLTANGMTTNKEDEKDCDYTEYYMDAEKPYLTAQGAKVMVQGTSSAAYGVAAFNVRTDFANTTMYDKDGNAIEGRKVSDTSIPVDFTCTKVNVASCENANNALNAEWYDRFQPYYDGHRRKSTATKKYRDCMEFDFGVMFIEDHNPNTNYKDASGKPDKTLYTSTNVFAYNTNGEEDRGYMNNKFYKQYAVANMGNDKKNRSVFHDTKNYKACCVEILDNQNAEHWMTKKVTTDDFKWDDQDTGFYEFRYSVDKYKGTEPIPDGKTKEQYQIIQAQAFIDFVNWMASCDPHPQSEYHPNGYTGEKLPQAVTYDKKTFTGFVPEGWDDSTSSGVSLKGLTISKYAKTYEYDTQEYRIAKMLNECENHLVMDSVVYHYLFIQRHTMVDNVAKNTFWSTEDLQHWDLTKNYDNDTSDGNDNSGYLRYGYGKEIMDQREDGADIFNASDSVWLNFIYNLPEVQEDLYKKLQDKKIDGIGVWDADAYLKLFKEKQALIPERCWIEDYFRKYIRPRRLGLDGDNSFIQRLEGGKKTHQRKQYETYQSYYIDSKYCSGAAFTETGSFDMRLNNGPKWSRDTVFTTQYYIDLYPSIYLGQQTWRGDRLSRKSTVDIPVGTLIAKPTDATCYIYAANMIQKIDGIADTYPNYMGVSAATKLRELEAGSSEENYFNDKLKNAVLDQNTQLEKAQLQQVGNDELSGLDLSKLTMLKELKIDMGSKFPTLKLAKGGIIHTLYLNSYLNSLNVKELKSLGAYDSTTGKGFKYDSGIFDKLTTVLIQGCPALNDFSYHLAKYNKITNYCFNDIIWNVPLSEEDIDIDNGKIIVLENLLETNENGEKLKGYVEVPNQTLALTGKIIIDLTNMPEGKKLDEYAIYAKYKKEFPNLEIEYQNANSNNLIMAKTITFYNDYNTETNQYRDIIYQVKTDGTKPLSFLTSTSGPTGVAIGTPTKESDKVYDYYWNNTWKDETGKIYTNENMLKETPTENKSFVAQYDNPKRRYTIVLRDYDGTDIPHSMGTQEYEANITNLMPFYMYRIHNTEGMRYEFQGWISAKDYLSGKQNVTPITNFVVEGDTTYYAFYEEQDCVTIPSRKEYFEFPGDGKTIYLKNKYRYLIQEPLTLPLMNGNTGITTIGDFGAYNHRVEGDKIKIPTIYFENNGVGGYYTTIQSYAFWSADQGKESEARSLLQSIYLPNSMKKIESYAFIGCTNLRNIELPDTSQSENGLLEIGTYAFNSTGKIQIDGTGLSKLTTLGTSAFYRGGDGVVLESIPNGLRSIPGWAFALCPNVSVGNFENVNTVGADAFNSCGQNKIVNILLPTNLNGYSKGCFRNYTTKDTLGTITYEGNGDIDEVTKFLWGEESTFDPTTIEQIFE